VGVQNSRVATFSVRPGGSIKERWEAWRNHNEVVNEKDLTVRYQELTTRGVPCFPVGVAIGDYE
jgi:hypothetical protein